MTEKAVNDLQEDALKKSTLRYFTPKMSYKTGPLSITEGVSGPREFARANGKIHLLTDIYTLQT